MINNPHVFIVILNWNRKDDSLRTLESIENLKINRFRLTTVMVDNGSTDGSAEALTGYKMRKGKYKYIQNPKNLGFAEGNNVGMRWCLNNRADFVMLLNDDTEVHSDLIEELLKVFEKFSDCGVASPKIYFAKGFEFKKRYKESELGKVVWFAGGDIDWNNVYGANHGVDEVDHGQFDKVVDTDFATGCCFFVKGEVLKKIGLFDPKYFAYFEDADLSQRIKFKGFRVLYAPPAKIWHKVSQSSGIGSELNDYFITRNRMLFGMRYASLRAKFALIRESAKFLVSGRVWQKIGIRDFYFRRFGEGSWK